MKIWVYLDIKSPSWHFEDAPASKFRIMGCKIEGGVSVESISLLKFEISVSILLNNIWLVSLCSVIWYFILVNMDIMSL